mgnify:CR=1 FL=1
MSHVITANFIPLTTARSTDSIWALTRAMKKSGWEVLASSAGSGYVAPTNYKYTTGAYFASTSSGADGYVTTFSTPIVTFTTVTGVFKQKNCGDFIEISGAASGGNNGRFIIITVNSATSVTLLNTAGVASDANNGSIAWTVRPRINISAEDTWQIGASLGSGAAGALGAGLTPDRMILTGLSGIAATDVGNWLVISGASTAANNGTWLIVRYISSSSVEVLAKDSAASYAGTISWTLRQGTGANIGNGTGASITTKASSGDDDFIVTGISHTLPGLTGGGAIGTTPSYNTVEVNNLTGITIADVGRWLTISGAANAGNNGEFLIVKYISATSVRILNANRVASDANAVSWAIRPGPEEGNFIGFSGAANNFNNGIFQITKTLGPTSCWARIPQGVANDANPISWVQKDPTTESLSNIVQWGQAGWITLRGPSMLKLPFSTGISGASSFLLGEKVSQSSTGAEGELAGITIDSAGTGWLVVSPQVKGTGDGYDFGWDLTTIIGSSSSASVVPTNVYEFQKEVQFATPNDANWSKGGFCSVTMTRKDSEQRQQLWVRSRNSSCANLVSPGSSSTTDSDENTFPTQGFAPIGIITGSYDYWHRNAYDPATQAFGKTQVMCANTIRRQNQSADGTFSTLVRIDTPNKFGGFSYQRVDNQEEGEVDPWAFLSPSGFIGNTNMWTPTRTGNGATNAINVYAIESISCTSNNLRCFMSTRARGVGTGEIQGVGLTGCLHALNASDATGTFITTYLPTSVVDFVASSATSSKRMMEPVMLAYTPSTSQRFRKGTCRWLFAIPQLGSSALDTWGDKSWVVGSDGGGTNATQPFLVGPWDGKSSPIA